MAHYLERALGTRQDVLVFHDLRLEKAGSSNGDGRADAAQIDHLVLHRWGAVIIESKSVTGSVRVNEQGEWCRVFGGKQTGMPSPVLQAERQTRFLRLYLDGHAEALLSKILGLVQARFGNMPLDVLVAISDQAVIERAKGLDLPQVCKADQVPDKVLALLERRKKASSLLSPNLREGGYVLSQADVNRISAFLLEHHRPLKSGDPAQSESEMYPSTPTLPSAMLVVPKAFPAPAGTEAPEAQPGLSIHSREGEKAVPGCRHCRRTPADAKLTITYGRYGYYYKCAACEGNTPIHETCGVCEGKARVRKEGERFYAGCQECGTSRLFFTNPS